MQRISTATRATDLFGAGKHGFKDGNPGLGILATQLNAAIFNSLQEELCTLIEVSAITLDEANRSQLAQAIQNGKIFAAVAAGTADALTATFAPAVPALVHGMTLRVRAASANTTATPTFSANGLTAKQIVKSNNQPLVAGDIAGAGHWLHLTYDLTLDKWVLANPSLLFASAAEAQALSIANKIITPAGLAAAFQGANQSLAANGYQKLPGGLVLQWGILTGLGATTSGSITFPVAFPSAVYFVTFADLNVGTGGIDFGTGYSSVTTTGLSYTKASARSEFYWAAIGK